ncbi:hypothetical protein [Photobacterium marinum]|uniref:hypothetical protein n=1 Tax=Photobacterium marinum TaxID=1056511 RepID=UPI0005695E87|nr:hypothetical protein [Photobacterium marinum]
MWQTLLFVLAISFSTTLHSKSVDDYERLYRYLPCAGLQNKVADINAKYKGGTKKQKKEYWKPIMRFRISGKKKAVLDQYSSLFFR